MPANLVESIAWIFSGSTVQIPRVPRRFCSNVVPDSSINSRKYWSIWCRAMDLRAMAITSRPSGQRALHGFGGWHPCLSEKSLSA